MSKRTAEEAGIKSPGLTKKKRLNKERKNQANALDHKERKPVETNGIGTPAQVPEKPEKAKVCLTREEALAQKLERKAVKRANRLAEKQERDALMTPEELGPTKAKNEERQQKRAAKTAKRALKTALAEADSNEVGSESTNAEQSKTPSAVSSGTSPDAELSQPRSTHGGTRTIEPEKLSKTAAYVADPKLEGLMQQEVEEYLKTNGITIAESAQTQLSLRPILAFEYLPIEETQKSALRTFASPTAIQAAAWPYLLLGKDVIGVAETGSGKTLAFGVPCIEHIIKSRDNRKHVIRAVIVSPTRELATQIYEQLHKLAEPLELKVVCVYGGVSKDDQKKQLKHADIVVATPGRLNDLIGESAINLNKVSYLVLDEADRMLDKGFEEDVRKIINSTRPMAKRQTLMFTATWPESVRQLASTFMKEPVKINIGHATGELRANMRIEQVVEVIAPHAKQGRLLEIIKKYRNGRNMEKDGRILVFCLYKKEADRTHSFLQSRGIKCAAIHGDMSQQQRFKSLEQFKTGQVPCLIATDVAARGLDIPEVKLVINATFPLTAEDYVHRIGRTGRAGADGKAITLFTEHDKALAGSLINVLKAANQPVPNELLAFGGTVKKKGHEHYGAFYKDIGSMKTATKTTFDD